MIADREHRAAKLRSQSDDVLLGAVTELDDDQAFAIFYRRHRDGLISFLWRHTDNYEVAQDLAAESFATAYLKAGTFDPQRGSARSWLFGIARIALLASYRQRAVEQTARIQLGVVLPDINDEAWQHAEAKLEETLSKLVVGLDELSPIERDALIARIVDDRDYAEIAAGANATEAAVRQRVSRALRKLRELMRGRPG